MQNFLGHSEPGETHSPPGSIPWFHLESQAAWASIPFLSSPTGLRVTLEKWFALSVPGVLYKMETTQVPAWGSCWSGGEWDDIENTYLALPTVPGSQSAPLSLAVAPRSALSLQQSSVPAGEMSGAAIQTRTVPGCPLAGGEGLMGSQSAAPELCRRRGVQTLLESRTRVHSATCSAWALPEGEFLNLGLSICSPFQWK